MPGQAFSAGGLAALDELLACHIADDAAPGPNGRFVGEAGRV
jgi:hypothetical protein